MKRNYPDDREKYSMAALRFSMHREIGDTLGEMARRILRSLKRQGIGSHKCYLVVNKYELNLYYKCFNIYCYLLENKLSSKQELKCSHQYFTDATKEYTKVFFVKCTNIHL